ncbi:class I SAM-dependent methyltransferase [Marinobacter salinexigens]|uniref:Class I SAM-dependent methyltransferase n=1 Tax=Marinobacter salinexigens TaxID=2919747 RepID=A0A5B0VJE6_9GAMM|nr:methyltransferase [Marinobacter salinexigens]KAA1174827.1 class I SAM-dependent methyltransferase [Marinobacter salinexigens]
MTSAVLQTPVGPLTLHRPGGGRSLQAWDAADELLLEQAFERLKGLESPRVLVVDDAFGALTLGLDLTSPEVVSDSAVLNSAVSKNVALNAAIYGVSEVRNWLNPPEGPFDLVVMRIPRHADYLAWLLRWINGVLADTGVLLAGGMIKHLPDKSVDVFAEAVETEAVLPARKKARVVVCRAGVARLAEWQGQWKGYSLGSGQSVQALPAVFARERLDIGTQLFLPRVCEAVAGLVEGSRVLDLACGNGVVGLGALSVRPDLAVSFSDVSSQAVASARRNVMDNFPDNEAEFHHADGIPSDCGSFELILLNPPFHEGGVVGDHIALKLFRQAARHLAPNGCLLVVGNRHLGYHRSLRQTFSDVTQVDANPKFVAFSAKRPQAVGRS